MDFTLTQMWAQMGMVARLVVVVLGIMSIVVLAVSVERIMAYAKANKQSRLFAMAVRELLGKADFAGVAEKAAAFPSSHVGAVIRAAIAEYLVGKDLAGKQFDVRGAVHDATERATLRQMANLRSGLAALATIGSTAPFVGLFGTTFGIINSFQGMAKEGGGGLGTIAAGIAEALITTAVGIGVAIVAVLIYNYFTAKLEALEVDARESAGEVVALLARDHART